MLKVKGSPEAVAKTLNRKPAEVRNALQALNEFIGTWNGTGGPDKPRPDPRDATWKETITWSWRFKGDDAWLTFEVKGGKHLAGGEVRYDPAQKLYRLTATDAKKQRLDFDGHFEKSYLVFERQDQPTGETQTLTLNTAAEGARLVYRYATRPKGRTVATKVYAVAATKEGESLAANQKKNECVITGGRGTIAVSFMGETFYVCCSGCRDAFNENPEKYIAEFKAKKKK